MIRSKIDTAELQYELDRLQKWEKIGCMMSFNLDKESPTGVTSSEPRKLSMHKSSDDQQGQILGGYLRQQDLMGTTCQQHHKEGKQHHSLSSQGDQL